MHARLYIGRATYEEDKDLIYAKLGLVNIEIAAPRKGGGGIKIVYTVFSSCLTSDRSISRELYRQIRQIPGRDG